MAHWSQRFGPQPFTDPDPPEFYHCGCCESYHPANWDGDCRDDANRFAADELDELSEWTEVSAPESFDAYLDEIAGILGFYPDPDQRAQFERFYEDGIEAADALSAATIRVSDSRQAELAL